MVWLVSRVEEQIQSRLLSIVCSVGGCPAASEMAFGRRDWTFRASLFMSTALHARRIWIG